MKAQLRLAAVASLLLAGTSCTTNPTSVCVYQLSDFLVTLPVGESATVENISRCNTAQPVPVKWSGRHPEVVTVTSSPDLSQASLDANAPGVDTVTAQFATGRSVIVIVRVTGS